MMIPAVAVLRRRYGALRHPLLIVAGTDDTIVGTDAQSRRLHKETPHSELLLYPGVGHMVTHAVPGAIAAAIRAMTGALRPRRDYKEWLSQFPPGKDGDGHDDERVDATMEDSFPASDPPGYMARMRLGSPPPSEA